MHRNAQSGIAVDDIVVHRTGRPRNSLRTFTAARAVDRAPNFGMGVPPGSEVRNNLDAFEILSLPMAERCCIESGVGDW